MNYLIYGKDKVLVSNALKNLLEKIKKEDVIIDENIFYFSMRESLVQDAVFEAMSYSFLGGKKIIVLKDCYFLSKDKEKISIDKNQNFDSLISYLSNIVINTNLIMVFDGDNLDLKSKIYQLIKTKGKIIALEKLDEQEMKSIVNNFFKKNNVIIDELALNELINRVNGDITFLINEAKKLALYKKQISLEDVKVLTPMPLEDNVFSMVNFLIEGQSNLALKIYHSLLIRKEEPVRLISLIASQLRFLNQVSYLNSMGKSYQRIVDELKANPYRVKRNLKTILMFSKKQINNILEALYQLDFKIKSGSIDPALGLELFIINFSNIKKLPFGSRY